MVLVKRVGASSFVALPEGKIPPPVAYSFFCLINSHSFLVTRLSSPEEAVHLTVVTKKKEVDSSDGEESEPSSGDDDDEEGGEEEDDDDDDDDDGGGDDDDDDWMYRYCES